MPVSTRLKDVEVELKVTPALPSDFSSFIEEGASSTAILPFELSSVAPTDWHTRKNVVARLDTINKTIGYHLPTTYMRKQGDFDVPVYPGNFELPAGAGYSAKLFAGVQRALETILNRTDAESVLRMATGSSTFKMHGLGDETISADKVLFNEPYRAALALKHPAIKYKDDPKPSRNPYFEFPIKAILQAPLNGTLETTVSFSPSLLFTGILVPVLQVTMADLQTSRVAPIRILNAESAYGLQFHLRLTLPEAPTTETINVDFLNLFAEDAADSNRTGSEYLTTTPPAYRVVDKLADTGPIGCSKRFLHLKAAPMANGQAFIDTATLPLQPFKMKFVGGVLQNPTQYFWSDAKENYTSTWGSKPADAPDKNFFSVFTSVKILQDRLNPLVYNIYYVLPKKRFLGVGAFWFDGEWGKEEKHLTYDLGADIAPSLTITNPISRTRVGFLDSNVAVESYNTIKGAKPDVIPNNTINSAGLNFRSFYRYEYQYAQLFKTSTYSEPARSNVSYDFNESVTSSSKFYIRLSPSIEGKPASTFAGVEEDELDPSLEVAKGAVHKPSVFPVSFSQPLPAPDQAIVVEHGVEHKLINTDMFESDLTKANAGKKVDIYYVRPWDEGRYFHAV